MGVASLILSIISIIFTAVTIVFAIVDRNTRKLKYKICTYIYENTLSEIFSDKLPSTEDIIKAFNNSNCHYKTSKIRYLLIELLNERKIQIIYDLETKFEHAKWKSDTEL